VIDDDGWVIWESGAILLHLAERYGKLLPADPRGRSEAIQYAFFQTGGIGPNMGRFGEQVRKPAEERNQEMLELFSQEVSRLIGVLDRILSEYLAREYSIGDIMHYPWLQPLMAFKHPMITERKRVVEWMERIEKRPAVERGMQIPA
jgi:GST-like protein